jgi:hypothetical protein
MQERMTLAPDSLSCVLLFAKAPITVCRQRLNHLVESKPIPRSCRA